MRKDWRRGLKGMKMPECSQLKDARSLRHYRA